MVRGTRLTLGGKWYGKVRRGGVPWVVYVFMFSLVARYVSSELGTMICGRTPMPRIRKSSKYGLWFASGRLCFVLGRLGSMHVRDGGVMSHALWLLLLD